MNFLTVGMGEVGSAIYKIVGGSYTSHGKYHWEDVDKIDVINICIPYSKEFDRVINSYKKTCPLVIVHSSVPVGTCDKLDVVHSPIRGVHPKLEEGIRTFVKYFGGRQAQQAAKIFTDLGIKSKIFRLARTTEAIKLWDTTQYGRLIMLEKEIYEWCKKNKVDFDAVYTKANQDYNEGYTKLNMPQVVRPWLKHIPGKIGGHCINENAKLLRVKL